jgi:hypothetical protein
MTNTGNTADQRRYPGFIFARLTMAAGSATETSRRSLWAMRPRDSLLGCHSGGAPAGRVPRRVRRQKALHEWFVGVVYATFSPIHALRRVALAGRAAWPARPPSPPASLPDPLPAPACGPVVRRRVRRQEAC